MKIHFDFLGPIYDFIFPPTKPVKLFDLLDVQTQEKIIEIGGGTGRTIKYFKRQTDYIYMIEPSQPMLAEAKRKYPYLKVFHGYAENLPLPSNYFDHVIIVDSLHHWDQQKLGLKEAIRILKPHGKLLIGEVHPKQKIGFMVVEMEKWMRMHSTFFMPNELKEIVLQHSNIKFLKQGWIHEPTYYTLFEKLTAD